MDRVELTAVAQALRGIEGVTSVNLEVVAKLDINMQETGRLRVLRAIPADWRLERFGPLRDGQYLIKISKTVG